MPDSAAPGEALRFHYRRSSRHTDLNIGDIATFRTNWDSEAIKRKSTLNLALVAWPNVVFDLREHRKVRRRRIISTIAHRLDDPAAFHAAIASLEPRHGDRGI